MFVSLSSLEFVRRHCGAWEMLVELLNLFQAHVVKLPSFGQKTAMQGHLCCKERMKVLL